MKNLDAKVMLAMSGGVDSSVALLLLKEKYDIVGVTMKVWDSHNSSNKETDTSCCDLDAINDAAILADKCGVSHYVVDLQKEFDDIIINDFVKEYLSGRTPNPCVLCNKTMKWGELLKIADKTNCKYIATGHYASVKEYNGRKFVSKGKDLKKDQSYMLWTLSQEYLNRTIFPLGNYNKEEIKQMANDSGYDFLTKKKESFDICFIPDNDYRSFLNDRVEGLKAKYDKGDFVDVEGNVLGQHRGFPYYTIGQRKGLEIALGIPMYVKEIRAETNQIVLAEEKDLYNKEMIVEGLNFQKYETIEDGMELTVKIRYHDAGSKCKVYLINDYAKVVFEDQAKSVTPGQSAVFYEDDDVVFGGYIK